MCIKLDDNQNLTVVLMLFIDMGKLVTAIYFASVTQKSITCLC